MASRRIKSQLRLSARDWAVPNDNPLKRHQKTRKVNIPYRGSDVLLYLLIDRIGIKAQDDGACKACNHRGMRRRLRCSPVP